MWGLITVEKERHAIIVDSELKQSGGLRKDARALGLAPAHARRAFWGIHAHFRGTSGRRIEHDSLQRDGAYSRCGQPHGRCGSVDRIERKFQTIGVLLHPTPAPEFWQLAHVPQYRIHGARSRY